MKIGILTHHWLYNFGANLQALATQNCLRSMGHDPIIINYRPPKLVERYDKIVSAEQQAAHASFRDKHLIESEVCNNLDDVIRAAEAGGVEGMISGSDAVLRINTTVDREDLNFPNPFWLNWAVDRGMRTGFLAASSMGSNYLSLPGRTRGEVGILLNKIDVIGVRDNWTRWMLSICNRKAEINFCPDPVSVFNDVVPADLYPQQSNEDYVLLSLYQTTVSNSWINEFVKIANENGLKVFSLPHPELQLDGPFDQVLQLPMSPLQWYSWLKHSKGYVGVRFHPIMISLMNQVPFVALDQYEVGLKFNNRWISRLASLVARPWRRHTSKTFDVTRRAGKTVSCLNRKMYGKRSASDVFRLLQQQMNSSSSSEFAQNSNSTFTSFLKQITAASNN